MVLLGSNRVTHAIVIINRSGIISPGCGCDEHLVNEIFEDLKARQRGRGDQGQIERAETTLEALQKIDSKLDAIMTHLKMERN